MLFGCTVHRNTCGKKQFERFCENQQQDKLFWECIQDEYRQDKLLKQIVEFETNGEYPQFHHEIYNKKYNCGCRNYI
jgi:hypothetical protein